MSISISRARLMHVVLFLLITAFVGLVGFESDFTAQAAEIVQPETTPPAEKAGVMPDVANPPPPGEKPGVKGKSLGKKTLDLLVKHKKTSIIVGILAFLILIGVWNTSSSRQRVYFYYFAIPAALLLWSIFATENTYLYLWVFVLGMASAFAEIIQKFRDDPLEALGTWQALLYHLINGTLAIFAFVILDAAGVTYDNTLDKIKIILTAGFGSMLVMRSKLFSVDVKGQTIAVGPEQLINVYLSYMRVEIDRVRSVVRMDIVEEVMDNINFDNVKNHTLTMIHSRQALDNMDELKAKIIKIGDEGELTTQEKSYRLGFLLLTEMGEEFLRHLFEEKDKHPEWLIVAPSITQAKDTIVFKLFSKDEVFVPLFIYDGQQSEKNLAELLGWSLEKLKDNLGDTPVDAKLKGYRMESPATEDECATLIEDTAATVDGVLYHLPENVIKYLDAKKPYCMREEFKVVENGKKDENAIQAQVYVKV